MIGVDTIEIFPVPIWISRVPNYSDIKNDIISFLEAERNKDPQGAIKSNWEGIGYHSKDLSHHEELAPIFRHVLDKMVAVALRDCEIKANSARISSSWCMFNDKLNAFNSIHAHHGVFSGIFYANAPEGSGELVLKNMGFNELWHGSSFLNQNGLKKYNTSHTIFPPEEGMVIMWSSYIPHFVTTNYKDVKRISVSFNIDCNNIEENANG